MSAADVVPGDAVPAVAGPRTHKGAANLSPRYMVKLTSMREGAHDYESIPSRVGDSRRPHLVTSSLAGAKHSE